MQAELAQWDKLDSQKLRTLTGMLQLLQADTRPEADQPEVRWQHHAHAHPACTLVQFPKSPTAFCMHFARAAWLTASL